MRGKKIRGRKRHLLVDTQGLPLGVLVTGADISDKEGARSLLMHLDLPLPRMQKLWGDNNYGGTLPDWVRQQVGWELEIVKPPERFDPRKMWPLKRGRPSHEEREARAAWLAHFPAELLHPEKTSYPVRAHRWVVERTFSWCSRVRRLARDYEGLPQCSEALIQLALSRLMLRRLAASP